MDHVDVIKKFKRCQEVAEDLGMNIDVGFDIFEIAGRGNFDSVDTLYSFLCGFEQGRSFGLMETIERSDG